MIRTYTGWWVTPRGERQLLSYSASSKAAAVSERDRILPQYEKEVEGYPEGYAEVCEKGILVKEFKGVSWPLDSAVVLLTEEYGYREWLWHTGMTDVELIAFWKALPSVSPYFSNPESLPGKLVPCWVGPHSDKGIYTFDPATFTYTDEGDWDGKEVFMEWPSPEDPIENRWVGHIHMDDDSGIGHSQYGNVTHAGFTG